MNKTDRKKDRRLLADLEEEDIIQIEGEIIGGFFRDPIIFEDRFQDLEKDSPFGIVYSKNSRGDFRPFKMYKEYSDGTSNPCMCVMSRKRGKPIRVNNGRLAKRPIDKDRVDCNAGEPIKRLFNTEPGRFFMLCTALKLMKLTKEQYEQECPWYDVKGRVIPHHYLGTLFNYVRKQPQTLLFLCGNDEICCNTAHIVFPGSSTIISELARLRLQLKEEESKDIPDTNLIQRIRNDMIALTPMILF
jgi:hypothetical protein